MRTLKALRDKSGASALEFALTAPFFFALIGGIIELGIVMWIQVALQQGAEAAARCASVNTTLCSSIAQIQSYASSQSYGLNPPPEIFSVSSPSCGNQITANYIYNFAFGYIGVPRVTLTAQSCFPK